MRFAFSILQIKSAVPTASLILIAAILSYPNLCACQPHFHNHRRPHGFTARDDSTYFPTSSTLTVNHSATTVAKATPCTSTRCVAATQVPTDLPCAAANGTAYTEVPEMDKYTIICNIDFPGQNIYPFVLAGSFEECLFQCENVNHQSSVSHCAGFVFAPERVNDTDDCYLKSALSQPGPATISLIGATLATAAASASSTAQSTIFPTTNPSSAAEVHQVQLRPPVVDGSQLLGASTDDPTDQYIEHGLAVPEKLDAKLLVPGINVDLITEYPIASDTGSWSSSSPPIKMTLSQMSGPPHLSRDGGKGGCINGTQIFIFCDTATFQNGSMNGFVSSSIAVDTSLNGRNGKALSMVDQIGEWQDDVGRMRGPPMTTGEEAFNIQLSGQGYRYAVWPESSPITLNSSHALLYASLVYDEVDMETQAANFTTLGNTLLLVSIDSTYGPSSQRVVNQLFQQDEIAWGSLGGIRSWGQSGPGGMDGMLYLFGQTNGGVLVARTNPFGIADRSTYSYWDGTTWSSQMLPPDATSYLLDMPVMDLDVFYSPYHGTFIMLYLTPNADNTIYFRYLKSDIAIVPPYWGGTGDYVQNIVTKEWSAQQVLYKAATPPEAYIYAGGAHAGYFGDEDITNGGNKMLISWTEHTGQDAASPPSGYSHMTVIVTFQ